METIASWGGHNLNAHEELSCSYQPSRKKREDTVYNGRQFSNLMSKDSIECDSSINETIPRPYYDNSFINHNDDFDDTEKSFEHFHHNMNLRAERRR